VQVKYKKHQKGDFEREICHENIDSTRDKMYRFKAEVPDLFSKFAFTINHFNFFFGPNIRNLWF